MKKIGKHSLNKKFKEFYDSLWDYEDKCFFLLTETELKRKFPAMSDIEVKKRHDEILSLFKHQLKNQLACNLKK